MNLKVFSLPKGKQGWPEVQDRIDWCRENFGERMLRGGLWDYDAVSHVIIIREEKNIILYMLRWS